MAFNYVTYGTNYWEKGYRNYEVTQGLFLQKATHDVDYISYLMGSPIEAGITGCAYICLAAKESAEAGRFVTVRQVGQSAG